MLANHRVSYVARPLGLATFRKCVMVLNLNAQLMEKMSRVLCAVSQKVDATLQNFATVSTMAVHWMACSLVGLNAVPQLAFVTSRSTVTVRAQGVQMTLVRIMELCADCLMDLVTFQKYVTDKQLLVPATHFNWWVFNAVSHLGFATKKNYAMARHPHVLRTENILPALFAAPQLEIVMFLKHVTVRPIFVRWIGKNRPASFADKHQAPVIFQNFAMEQQTAAHTIN